jgi:hypothetical protein
LARYRVANVARVVALPVGGREHEIVRAGASATGAVLAEQFGDRRGHDLANPGLGLCLHNPQLPCRQVQITPAEIKPFGDPQAGERYDRDGFGCLNNGLDPLAALRAT